jgi:hypothetical protein
VKLTIGRYLTNQGQYEYCVIKDDESVTRESFGLPEKEGFLWSWDEVQRYIWYSAHSSESLVVTFTA